MKIELVDITSPRHLVRSIVEQEYGSYSRFTGFLPFEDLMLAIAQEHFKNPYTSPIGQVLASYRTNPRDFVHFVRNFIAHYDDFLYE